jgi:hypothetical protein
VGDVTRFCGGLCEDEGGGPSAEGVVCIGGGFAAAFSAICSLRILHTFGTGAGLVEVVGVGATAGEVGVGDVGDVVSFKIPFIDGDSGLVRITLELGVTSALAGFDPSLDALDPELVVVVALEGVVEEVVPVVAGLLGR